MKRKREKEKVNARCLIYRWKTKVGQSPWKKDRPHPGAAAWSAGGRRCRAGGRGQADLPVGAAPAGFTLEMRAVPQGHAGPLLEPQQIRPSVEHRAGWRPSPAPQPPSLAPRPAGEGGRPGPGFRAPLARGARLVLSRRGKEEPPGKSCARPGRGTAICGPQLERGVGRERRVSGTWPLTPSALPQGACSALWPPSLNFPLSDTSHSISWWVISAPSGRRRQVAQLPWMWKSE